MRRALLASLALAAPAFAQEASPPVDWSKPVIYDTPAPNPEHAPSAVEIYRAPENCIFVQPLNAPPDEKAEVEFRSCLARTQTISVSSPASPSADPLAGYSPEMREKLRRFMPKPQPERPR